MRLRVPVLLAAVAAIGSIAPAGAGAVYSPPHLYDCKPRKANIAPVPPPPELPPRARAALPEAIESSESEPLCPAGEVPEPTPRPAPPKMPPPSRDRAGTAQGDEASPSAGASRIIQSSTWYSYATGSQGFEANKEVDGFWAVQTNEQPYIEPWESLQAAHSLGQLWGVNRGPEGNCLSSVETGWSESAGQFEDVEPHLFVYAFDCGIGLGYAGSSSLKWVQVSPTFFPNMVVSHNDVFHVYGMRRVDDNWWIYYDGQWVGYIQKAAWKYHIPYVFRETHVGGEVATPTYSTCTDMGYNGLFGSHPWAAMVDHAWYEYQYQTKAATSSLTSYESDPSNYTTGNWSSGHPGPRFRYGGPGWC